MNIEELSGVYDGSKSTFAVLEAAGWGPLMNLGYFSVPMLPALMIRGLAPFQQRLAHKSLDLLRAGDGDRVLDACCGRGYTTARIAEAGADVLGLDLLEEHVRTARQWYGTGPTLRFGVGDVTALPEKSEGFRLDDDSVDRVLCLEAAFHFSPQGRRDFLSESLRILRPGGRLVLVDFTWKNDDPGSIEKLDPKRLVRDAWGFDEFEPFDRYRATAQELGLREVQVCDWSEMVMARFHRVAEFFSRIGMVPVGRRALSLIRPALSSVEPEEWRIGHEAAHYHGRVASMSRYIAFVFQKPRRRTSRF